jgi:type I restriction enzyme S subunit
MERNKSAEMKFKRYAQYKDSGVNLLSNIPTHWHVQKLKHIASVRFSSVDKKTENGERPTHLCNYQDVYYNDYITPDIAFMEATASPGEITSFMLRKGDVIVTKDSESWDDIAVSAYVPFDLHGVLCGYHLAQIHLYSTLIDGEYLFRSFSAHGINDQFKVAATGITRYGLGKYWIDNAFFPVPPIDEQHAIKTFLNRETAKIDALIEKKERLIELLKEKRTALITHAVTKGLDLNAPMKDSGIEWIGEIPVHWQSHPFKSLFEIIYRYPTYYNIEYISEGVPEIRGEALGSYGKIDKLEDERYISNETNARYPLTRLKNGDIVMSVRGTMGKVGLVDERYEGANITANLIRLSPKDDVTGEFLRWSFLSQYFRQTLESISPQTTIKTITVPQLSQILIVFPPIDEQRKISEFLHREREKIDNLVKKISEAIERLREYRTALISAAVTGKIDVREEAA